MRVGDGRLFYFSFVLKWNDGFRNFFVKMIFILKKVVFLRHQKIEHDFRRKKREFHKAVVKGT